MIEKITSKNNNTLKKIRQLNSKKYRDKYNEYIIEGSNLLEEALKLDIKINCAVISEKFLEDVNNKSILDFLTLKKIELHSVSSEIYKSISDTQNPQGILAVVPKSKEEYSLDNIAKIKDSNILILDKVQDPGNLGTIIRTADAAGIDAIVLIKGCVDLHNLKVIRSTMGSIFRIPILSGYSIDEVISILKANNKNIISTDVKTDNNYYEIDMKKDIALVIGNEGNGVSEEFLHNSKYVIKIPMYRGVESLNASIAASILIYEIVRQKITNR